MTTSGSRIDHRRNELILNQDFSDDRVLSILFAERITNMIFPPTLFLRFVVILTDKETVFKTIFGRGRTEVAEADFVVHGFAFRGDHSFLHYAASPLRRGQVLIVLGGLLEPNIPLGEHLRVMIAIRIWSALFLDYSFSNQQFSQVGFLCQLVYAGSFVFVNF